MSHEESGDFWIRRYEDGLIVQGSVVRTSGNTYVTFPVPFTRTVCFVITEGFSAGANNAEHIKIVERPTLSGFVCKGVYTSNNWNSMSITGYWVAIGY